MNPDPQTLTSPGQGDQSMANVADPALTLAARKLAGSDSCLNCGTGLKGPFCYYCGQPDRNFLRFFPALVRDLLEDFLDLDSRFMRTLKPLLFKPGRLTRDYMNGRRFRYTPPMRLYIFSSIAFFLLAALLSSNAIEVETRGNNDGFVTITTDAEAERQKVEKALEKLPPEVREQVGVDQPPTAARNGQADNGPADGSTDETWFHSDQFQFNDKPWDRETNPVEVRWLPRWLNDRINDEIEESPKKAEQINKNPNLIVDKVFDILPATMFVLLPVVALIFKFWYLFAKRYYVEHLIFSLHNHAFLFVSLILMLLANWTGDLLAARGHAGAKEVTEWLITAISIWVPLYLLVSLRVVFRQNWFLTIGKFAVIGISYVVLLIIVTSGVAIASFILL